jgi:hypothetical protein
MLLSNFQDEMQHDNRPEANGQQSALQHWAELAPDKLAD